VLWRTCALLVALLLDLGLLSAQLAEVVELRSTPTWKLILRTVKVSRTLSPWRPMTTPWKTWIRERVPSVMFTCTLTVSPGKKSGMSERSEAASTASRICMIVSLCTRHRSDA
jgi:hypothetical protein